MYTHIVRATRRDGSVVATAYTTQKAALCSLATHRRNWSIVSICCIVKMKDGE
jgi:hypothetical protein